MRERSIPHAVLPTDVTGFAKVACYLCTASCLQTSANVAGECVQNVHNVTWEAQKARTYLYNLPPVCMYVHTGTNGKARVAFGKILELGRI